MPLSDGDRLGPHEITGKLGAGGMGIVLRARDTKLDRCRHCDAHHVRHWAAGGATRLENLLMLCRRHHRAVHEDGFTVELGDDGDARFFWPDGRPFPEAPSAPRWAGPALEPTTSHLASAGITIDGNTATPDWHGERLDLVWAIDVLRPPGPGVPAGRRRKAEALRHRRA